MTIDAELGEALQENEEQLTRQITAVIAEGIKLQHLPAQRPALRDAHPKAHGCVRADFQVEKDLPPRLAQGIFLPGRTYPALIRFDPLRVISTRCFFSNARTVRSRCLARRRISSRRTST